MRKWITERWNINLDILATYCTWSTEPTWTTTMHFLLCGTLWLLYFHSLSALTVGRKMSALISNPMRETKTASVSPGKFAQDFNLCIRNFHAFPTNLADMNNQLLACVLSRISRIKDFNNLVNSRCTWECFVYDDVLFMTGEFEQLCLLCPDDKLDHAADKCLIGNSISQEGKVFRYLHDIMKWCGSMENEIQVIVPNFNNRFPTTSEEPKNEPSHGKDVEQVMTDRPIACLSYLILGRITWLPTEGVCRVSNISALSVNDMKHQCGLSGLGNKLHVHVTTGSVDTCFMNPDLWWQVKVTWVCAKFNYGLLGINMITSVCVWLRLKFVCKSKSKFMHWFLLSNLLWIAWRSQETVHVDTRWRDDQSYVCMFTGSLGYTSESLSLYLMVGASLERMHALVSPYQWKSTRSKMLSLVCGFLVGLLCSVLNIAAVLAMDDPTVAQTCQVASDKESLEFLVTVKICSVLFIYVVPCCVLVYCNVAVLVAMKKMQSTGMRTSQHRNQKLQKATYRLRFIFVSSLLVMFHLPKAIFDLKRAFELHVGSGVDKSSGEILADGVLNNLTVCSLLLNTVIGMTFSTWRIQSPTNNERTRKVVFQAQ